MGIQLIPETALDISIRVFIISLVVAWPVRGLVEKNWSADSIVLDVYSYVWAYAFGAAAVSFCCLIASVFFNGDTVRTIELALLLLGLFPTLCLAVWIHTTPK